MTLRPAVLSDISRLVELNRAAYPDLVQDGVVFDGEQFRQHIARFPDGQIVCVIDGTIVGAISTLILPSAINALAPHTWMGVTDGGTFERHDPSGSTLYLADVYVDPSAWGKGVGRALYGALFDLCKKLHLARVVGGGRLYDYDQHANTLTPHDYVAKVVRGELRDRVLGSQLRAGFSVRGMLPNYLHDWRSRSWATLIVWENNEHAPVSKRKNTSEASVTH